MSKPPRVRSRLALLFATLVSTWIVTFLPALAVGDDALATLATVAEKTGFRRTASHSEVLAICDALAAASPRVVRQSLGTSGEGRDIPCLLVAEPPVTCPEEVVQSGRSVALLLGGIHSGESCGKEALLRLVRELIESDDPRILRGFVIAVVPLLNPDGNERVAPDNRPGQVGPEAGTGARENGQGLDLNRDWIKLEAPETRGVVKFLRRWDPLVTIDTHTTNGSYHRFGVTYAGPKHPAGNAEIIRFVRDELLPEAGRLAAERTGLRTFPYGNFSADHTLWTTYPDLPRYGTPYRGLRNRIALLSEAYAYSTFEERVRDTHSFVVACLDVLDSHRPAAVALTRHADEEERPLVLRTRAVPRDRVDRALGWVERTEDGKTVRTDEEREYEVRVVDRFEPVLSVSRPAAYLVPAELDAVIANLEEHGVRMEELREDVTLEVEVATVRSVERSDEEFQGHRLVTVDVERNRAPRRVPAGTILVPLDQPLGTLAGFLLEPEAADGLVAWNFFDEKLAAGEPYPILRLPKALPLRTASREPIDELERDIPLSFESVYTDRMGPSHSPPPRIEWLPDGERWLQVRDEEYWVIDAATGRMEPFVDRDRLAERLAEIPAIDDETARGAILRRAWILDPHGTAALLDIANDLYYLPLGDGDRRAVRLTSSPGEEEIATFSPDGRFVAFVRDDDLYVVDVETAIERALSTGGSDLLRNGKASWVYYEEVFDRDWKAYWWSPDSRRIAYLRSNSAKVEPFTLVDDRTLDQEVDVTWYPQAGEMNPEVELRIVSIAGEPAVPVDLSEYDPVDLLVTGVGWEPRGEKVWLFVQNRIQTFLDLWFVPASGRGGKKVLRQTTPAWVDPPLGPFFLADGSFLLSSEADAWRHLYSYAPNGEETRRLTRGDWEVREVASLDEEGGFVYFTATRDSPIAHNLYRVPLAGGEIERLTPERGHHSVEVAPGARWFTDTWSSVDEPPRSVLRGADGSLARWLDTQPARDLERWRWGRVELTTIPVDAEEDGDQGASIQASFTFPPDFDPNRRWPVWFFTYGGPRASTVWDRWRGSQLNDQVLAAAGIVVFRCDPRSASGIGGASVWRAWGRLGSEAHEDVVHAIEWLRDRPWVDPDRIGMSGHSFGGYLTAYSMTHSDLFAAGVAGAPVTDWRYYDTIYTERYMKTPWMNPEGYEETSVVRAADRLHGHLLIVHGTIDDNVHLQNTIQLVDALQRAGKDFELMLYPGARHGIHGSHYRRLLYDFILRTVGGGTRKDEALSVGARTQ